MRKNRLHQNFCFRYLATGNTFTDLHFTFRMGISTISGIVELVCDSIWKHLSSECLPDPSKNQWLEIARGFAQHANFPNCLGAVDGKHIRIIKPIHSGSDFFNYKKYFSIVLLAMCDSNYCFTYIDVGAYGKFSDSNIFNSGKFWQKIQSKSLSIPDDAPPEGYDKTLPFVFVGDEAFPLSQNLMRPYARKNLNYKKKVYNYRHTRARRFIECSFGILSNKWRVFHRPLNVSLRLAKKITKACCVLHNYVCAKDGYAFHHTLSIQGLTDLRNMTTLNRSAWNVRDDFANYFVSPVGKLSWQDSKI